MPLSELMTLRNEMYILNISALFAVVSLVCVHLQTEEARTQTGALTTLCEML
jgi:hypothetical protein